MSTNVGSIYYDLSLNTARFEMALASIKTQMSGMNAHVNTSGNTIKNFESSGGSSFMALAGKAGLVGAAIAGFGYAVKNTVGPLINIGSEAQNLRTNLDVLTGSTQKGQEMYKKLVDFAAKTPFETTELVSATQQMLSFGITTDKVMPYLKSIGDVSMGNKDKLAGLTYAFSQVQSTGRLMGQDLLQMINNGFNPLEEISRKTGKSMATLKDEMSQGKISAQDVADAFQSATEKGGRFYGGMEKGSQTLSGRMSTLKDNAKTAIRAVLGIDEEGNVKAGGLFDRLSKGMEKLFPIMEKIAKNAGPAVSNILKAIDEILRKLHPVFVILGEKIKEATKEVTKFWNENKSWLIPLLKIIGGIIIGLVVVAIASLVESIRILFNAMNTIRTAIVWVIEKFNEFADWVGRVWNSIKSYFSNAINTLVQAGKDLVQGFINGLTSMFSNIWNALTTVFSAIGRFFSGVWDWLKWAGESLVRGFVNGVKNVAGHIWDGLSSTFSSIGRFFNGVWSWLTWAGESLVNGFVQGIKNMFWAPYNALRDVLNKAKSLFPRSPAKEGPFSGKGWTLYSGQSLVQGFADGIENMSDLPQIALNKVMSPLSANINNPIALNGNTPSISNSNQVNNQSVNNIYGNISLGDSGAVNTFFDQLNRNQELAGMGLGVL